MADERMNDAIPDSERIGFCQDCGKPLSAATIRTVGSGVFCEPCLERRVAGGASFPTSNFSGAGPSATYAAGQPGPSASQASWQSVGGYPPPPPVPPSPGTPIYTGEPTPWLAGLLGFIPGVGAMYNGQFAKGVVHLIVFAVLVSLSDHVSGVFGLFVAGWVFFMVFEAYQTAQARRAGLPLPDPFGWNNIGERLGFSKNWPGSFTTGVPPAQPNAPWQQAPPTQRPADWVGYVPPTNYATTPDAGVPASVVPPPPVVEPQAYPSGSAPVTPLTSPYITPAAPAFGTTNVPYAEVGAAPGAPLPDAAPTRHFPVGAMWLIGLGLLFLIGNVSHTWHLSWRWLAPAFVAGFAIYLLVSRLQAAQAADTLGRPYQNRILLFRGPVMMLTVAVLLALQSFDILTFGQTWPVLLVMLGALLLLERTVVRRQVVGPLPVMDSDATVSPSSWNAAKGGQ